MTNVSVQRKDVISLRELNSMFENASMLKEEYFRLRAKAILSTFKTGKRRVEVASLEVTDVRVEGQYLYITFSVVKKRKKNILTTRRTKRFRLESQYAQHILTYLEFLRKHYPQSKYLFPSVRSVFGRGFFIYPNKHLSGRQILNIVKDLNPNAWCHLFRETRGAEIVKHDEKERGEASILTVYRVKRSLDLESEQTAWRYIDRYATETIADEEEIEIV